jgi:oxygen-independent coproporphyrinogen-3 oxidase
VDSARLVAASADADDMRGRLSWCTAGIKTVSHAYNAVMPAPLAVYVHLPWCVRKCPYCDFNSHAAPRDLPEAPYVDALLADLDSDLDLVAGRQVDSVFFGGGTPSLFDPASIARVLAGIRTALPVAPGAEITLEANPGTVERGRFDAYAEAGVNRVSLGAQSFSGPQLEALGRIHSPGDTESAVQDLLRAGIDNFNLDLMYGLPSQTVDESVADLRAAISLGPAHLSHYQLTLEPGTAFHHQPPPLPDDELALGMQLACQEELATAGFAQYEVSAYAQPGRRCRHNLAYWTFGDYLGLGAGAHGKLSTPAGILRTEKARMPREYIGRVATGSAGTRRGVASDELPFEFALNALRLAEGSTLGQFEAATGLSADVLQPTLASLAARGLIDVAGARFCATTLGFRFLNDVMAAFLPDRPAGSGKAA